MERNKKQVLSGVLLAGLVASGVIHAAKPVDLSLQPVSSLQSFIPTTSMHAKNVPNIKEINRHVGVNQKLHIRIQQTYAGYPVYGADAVLHMPNRTNVPSLFIDMIRSANVNQTTMNGKMYQDLQVDLANAPSALFSDMTTQKVLSHAKDAYENSIGKKVETRNEKSQAIVFVDKNNKAHWAYQVSFRAPAMKKGGAPTKPTYLIDATTMEIYRHWNDMKTDEVEGLDVDGAVLGGGFGGNQKMGKLVYDGLGENLGKLNLTKAGKLCFLKNDDVLVQECKSSWCDEIADVSFKCGKPNKKHDKVFWDASLHKVNGSFSPDNDVLFNGAVIKDIYKKWFDVDVLTQENGEPMQLDMIVHEDMENAYWDGKSMHFGDGGDELYPLTSLGVAAHEISHGFTEQHSALNYYNQSGGMNESFSDMAAQAAEFYAYGKSSWQIGAEIFKAEDEALRYMDQPSKDCKGGTPGNGCSIDSADQYNDDLDVHYSSGVYNHFFYLLGTSADWDTKKAFEVMVDANANYWTSDSTYQEAACGVIQATVDRGYDVDAVQKAFAAVAINTSACPVSKK
jgi:pseudolysin